jgi:3-methyladenine DNA glycosylase AlkD
MDTLADLKRALAEYGNPKQADILSRFFKTGPGEYGEGDVFIGVKVPQIRTVARQYRALPLSAMQDLLSSSIHEERLCAVLLLVHMFEHGDAKARRAVYRFYIAHTDRINNWDLVDLSAPNIVGAYLLETKDSGAVLVKFAKSRNVWQRRIAILSTFAFIRAGRHVPTFNIARMLVKDEHDLIHKAVGWMLREVGKRIGQEAEEDFLQRYYRSMPRTMLRYAIERFPKKLYRAYLEGRA